MDWLEYGIKQGIAWIVGLLSVVFTGAWVVIAGRQKRTDDAVCKVADAVESLGSRVGKLETADARTEATLSGFGKRLDEIKEAQDEAGRDIKQLLNRR